MEEKETQNLRGKALAAIAYYVCAHLRRLRRPKGERRSEKVGPIEAAALSEAKGPGILLSIARAVTSEDPSELTVMASAYLEAANKAADADKARDRKAAGKNRPR